MTDETPRDPLGEHLEWALGHIPAIAGECAYDIFLECSCGWNNVLGDAADGTWAEHLAAAVSNPNP